MSKIDNWKTMADISDDIPEGQFIKTGFVAIDKHIQGLILSGTSIISGTSGAAKSTVLSQIALNVINTKQCKVGIFSGELPNHRFKKWLYLQASGKLFNKQKKDDNGNLIDFYYTPRDIVLKITEWLGENLYLYDNDKGFTIENVGNSIDSLLKTDSEVKLIIIDNLMTLDINKLSEQKYEAQKQLILKMCCLAKKYNVHICFVCHPTKMKSLIRKEDISGSSDLTNAVDNVIICHRSDTIDFRVRAKEYFGWKDDNPIFGYSNAIEIVKDRENGAIEKIFGFYFEKESKRIKNSQNENINYGWNKTLKQGTLEDLVPIEDDGELPF